MSGDDNIHDLFGRARSDQGDSVDDSIDDLFADEPTPDPDAPIDDDELARAAQFGDLIDGVLTGSALPASAPASQRELADVAGIVRASMRDIDLDSGRTSQIIDQALGQALGRALGRSLTSEARTARSDGSARAGAEPDATGADRTESDPAPGDRDGISDLGAYRRKRLRRVIPMAVAGLAAAAALVLVLNRSEQPTPGTNEVATAEILPVEQRSRPADRLVGEIPRERVGQARERIDRIYSDRMAGYRALRFGGGR